MNSESISNRPLRKALILNGIALIAIIVLSALGIWLVNEWVML
ncbi:integrase [Klebsiella pneumoniae]|uniref:Integrase n=1 Tax=Klebsiella pneumoniae TaxID=573 RepID=A0A6G4MEB7_KLEPN|nr:integrase [Klebsiella pneumoniae]APM52452.1 integrase [Klebsiella pneumoniae]MBZ7040794.1 integrase [Klebsiella pneumoniae]MCH1795754.1 integrase [Klebsiella pneumoniae]MCI7927690.1 integrase [Klebsiella pneumoniae]MCI7932822.1 integrase [Klebsiella pneumoniae]